jgi:hypothetical protein
LRDQIGFEVRRGSKPHLPDAARGNRPEELARIDCAGRLVSEERGLIEQRFEVATASGCAAADRGGQTYPRRRPE